MKLDLIKKIANVRLLILQANLTLIGGLMLQMSINHKLLKINFDLLDSNQKLIVATHALIDACPDATQRADLR